jgi:hypothetical protein
MRGRKDIRDALKKTVAKKRILNTKALRARAAERALKRGQGKSTSDRNAEAVAQQLQRLVRGGKLQIPRSGYLLRSRRGKLIIERPSSSE